MSTFSSDHKADPQTQPERPKVLRSLLARFLSDYPAGEFALRIVDAVIMSRLAVGSRFSAGTLLAWIGEEGLSVDFMSAMALLSGCRHHVFNVSADFMLGNGERCQLSSAEFQRCRDENRVLHPVTGVFVENAGARVVPMFDLVVEIVNDEVDSCLNNN